MRDWLMVMIAAVLSVVGAAGAHDAAVPAQEQMLEAFERGEFALAREIAERIIKDRPSDWRTRYNLAVILARMGDADAGSEALIDAISFGFVDLHEMERDPNLAGVRRTDQYRRIIERWGVLLDAVARARFDDTKAKLGSAYRDAEDPEQRVLWLSVVEGNGFETARRETERVRAWCDANGLFEEADARRPDPWVTVIIPTADDFAALVPYAMVGGTYSRDDKRLVTRDMGPTLRHEFFHVLHWRDMDRRGQVHPIWVQEGMASLLEDVETDEGGGYEITASWRTNIAKRMERAGALRALDVFLATPRDRFVSYRPSANYAVSRALMMFVEQRGALGAFYKALVSGFEDDPSGVVALEVSLGMTVSEIDRAFRVWLQELPEVAERAHPPDAVLGVAMSEGRGEGPIVAGGMDLAGRSALRPGDVIVKIDDRAVTTMDDLYRVLGDFEVGEEVTVGVRRSGRAVDVVVKLRAREHHRD